MDSQTVDWRCCWVVFHTLVGLVCCTIRWQELAQCLLKKLLSSHHQQQPAYLTDSGLLLAGMSFCCDNVMIPVHCVICCSVLMDFVLILPFYNIELVIYFNWVISYAAHFYVANNAMHTWPICHCVNAGVYCVFTWIGSIAGFLVIFHQCVCVCVHKPRSRFI